MPPGLLSFERHVCSRGEGICHERDDENHIVSSWKEAGDEGTWEILSAAGTYSGSSGKGTYTSSDGPHGMRITVWEGEGIEGR